MLCSHDPAGFVAAGEIIPVQLRDDDTRGGGGGVDELVVADVDAGVADVVIVVE